MFTQSESTPHADFCSICNDRIFRYAYVIGGKVYCNKCLQENFKVSVSEIDKTVANQLKEANK